MIQESNLVFVLIVFLTPFLVLTILMTFVPKLAFIMPFLCISQCQGNTEQLYYQYINHTMMFTILANCFSNTIFFMCLFVIRHVSKTFSTSKELRSVICVLFIAFSVQTVSVLYLD